MYSKRVRVVNKLGIHARPAMKISETARKFKSKVFIEKDGQRVDATSLLDILILVSPPGTELTIVAEGPDEKEAVEAIAKLVEEGFGEEIDERFLEDK